MSQDLEANKRNAIDCFSAMHTQYPAKSVRFDAGGKVVEHGDAIQRVPAETQSGRTKY